MENYIRETLAEINPDAMLFTGFDNCIIGVDTGDRAVYSLRKIVEELMSDGDTTEEDALEYYQYNMERSLTYMNRDGFAPIVLDDFLNCFESEVVSGGKVTF